MTFNPKVLKVISDNHQIIASQMVEIRLAIQKAYTNGEYELQYSVWLTDEETALIESYNSEVSIGEIGSDIRKILMFQLMQMGYSVSHNPGSIEISWEYPLSDTSQAAHSRLLADGWRKLHSSLDLIPGNLMDAAFNGESSIGLKFDYVQALDHDAQFAALNAKADEYRSAGYLTELSSNDKACELSISW